MMGSSRTFSKRLSRILIEYPDLANPLPADLTKIITRLIENGFDVLATSKDLKISGKDIRKATTIYYGFTAPLRQMPSRDYLERNKEKVRGDVIERTLHDELLAIHVAATGPSFTLSQIEQMFDIVYELPHVIEKLGPDNRQLAELIIRYME